MEKFLISMAMVKVNWDESQRSIIDTYMPLIGYAISQCKTDVVSVEEVARILADEAEFYIPQGALIVLVNRATKRAYKYLKKENRAYVKNHSALKGLPFEKIRMRLSRSQNSLRLKFRSFCKDTLSKAISSAEIDKYFFEILYDFSPNLAERLWSARSAPTDQDDPVQEGTLRYDIYKFVEYTIENDPDGYEAIDAFVRGAMLTESFYYGLPQNITQKFRSTDVYLDTQFLLRALGWADDYFVKPCVELLEMLREAGVRTRCFRKTLEEIYGILTAAARAPRLSSFTPVSPRSVSDYFSRSGLTKADIELEIARLEDSLKGIGIKSVVDFPPYTVELGIDEVKLNEFIATEISWQTEKARKHDIDCLTAIFRLRHGQTQKYIESCNAIFITTNTALARTSTKFFNEEYEVSDAPVCMTDHIFAMLLWIKVSRKRPDVPKEQLVAIAFAATNPSDDLWKKYISAARQYMDRGDITEADYALLVNTLEARSYLTELTEGDSSAFVQGSVKDILEKIKYEMLHDSSKKLEQESLKNVKMTRRIEGFISRMVNFVERLVKFVILSVIVIILLLGLIIIQSPQLYDFFMATNSLVVRVPAFIVIGLLFAATVFSLMFGTRLADLASKPAKALGAFLRRILEQQLAGE